jgi:O-antigen/teichoic acid export membrane protein
MAAGPEPKQPRRRETATARMNSLARNIVRTFSTQVGCQLIAILSGVVIARMIGPAGKGFFSYAATCVSFVSVFFYGFSDAVLVQFGKRRRSARVVNGITVKILAAVLAAVIPVFVIIAIYVPSQRPLAAAAAVLPFAMYMQVMTPFLMVRDQVSLLNARTLVQSLGTALCTIPLLLFTQLGLIAVIGVWILFYASTAFQYAWSMRRVVESSPQTQEESPKELMREQLRFGLRAAGGSTAGFLNMRVDIFVVSFMFAPAALGWYTLAIGTGELLWQVSRAFVWSALGRIGSDPLSEAAALVARLTRNTLAIVGSLGLIAFVAGPWLIVHIYGDSFAPAGLALRWALPGLVAYAAEVALTKFIVLQLGRPLTTVWVQLGAAALCALITIATAGRFGIAAAAAATSITYLIVTVVLTTIFLRATQISLARLLIVQREDLSHYTSVLQATLRTLRLRSA